MSSKFVTFARELYQTNDFIPLHAPQFSGREKEYLCDIIDSTYVSSVSEYVEKFEQEIIDLTGCQFAVGTMNGTAALHLALHCCGATADTEVITQAFSFVGTANAIQYCNARPIFIDISTDTLGLSPDELERFLDKFAEKRSDGTFNKSTGKKIAACVPMHTFGHPAEIERIAQLCKKWKISLVEDAAEALGSYTNSKHCGIFGECGILSFNGNKIITTGGGGAVMTNDEVLAHQLRHVSTTAKVPHSWEFHHDQLGFNYRMPGINAALGCAQFEALPEYLNDKRVIANEYDNWANSNGVKFVKEPPNTKSNYWLNAFEFESEHKRDEFLKTTNAEGVMTRPPWNLLCDLPMYDNAICTSDLPISRHMSQVLVNIPSSMRSR